jgi:hypothetical protein
LKTNAQILKPDSIAIWKYKGIYHEAVAQVGQWGDIVSVTVAG